LNEKGKYRNKGPKGGDEGEVGQSILGKRRFSKKRESIGKLISLFRNFHRRMNHVLRGEKR